MSDVHSHRHRPSASVSPNMAVRAGPSTIRDRSLSLSDRERGSMVDWRTQPASPPLRPTPSSRMSLSALVNSPPGSPPPSLMTTSTSRIYRSPSYTPPPSLVQHRLSNSQSRSHAAYANPVIASGSTSNHSRRNSRSTTNAHQHGGNTSLDYSPDGGHIYYNTGAPPNFPPQSSMVTPTQHSHHQHPSSSHHSQTNSGYRHGRRASSSSHSHSYLTPSLPLTTAPITRPAVAYDQLERTPPLHDSTGGRSGGMNSGFNFWNEKQKDNAVNGDDGGSGVMGKTRSDELAYRLGDGLMISQDVWEDALKGYQAKREQEVNHIMSYDDTASLKAQHAVPAGKSKKGRKILPLAPSLAGNDAESASQAGTEDIKPNLKRKGAPTGKKRGSRKSKAADIEDELLGLAEKKAPDDTLPQPSSPGLMYSDHDDEEEEDQDEDEEERDPNILESGKQRDEVIKKIEMGDMDGLTEADVKAVQDEMWIRSKESAGGVGIRKDGTLRRKPGPAKGWKQLRGEAAPPRDRRKKKISGDLDGVGPSSNVDYSSDVEGNFENIEGDEGHGDEEEEMAVNGVTNGDDKSMIEGLDGVGADDEIAALIDQPEKPRRGGWPKGKKRRKVEEKVDELTRNDEDEPLDQILGEEGIDVRSSVIDSEEMIVKKKVVLKTGKGKSNKAVSSKKAEQLDDGDSITVDDLIMEAVEGKEVSKEDSSIEIEKVYLPNTEDPRGVSEAEAKVRFDLVEELQRQAWSACVKDVPKIYRVFQGYDSSVKQSKIRLAQACYRNAFSQRQMKPTFKSVARINKDAISKSRRVVKEMLLYWRKNEKDELAARKKAEKEALEKAKAEEEAREAKRQSRKLNFLLTQTELYSHFIGKKIKTADAERPDEEGEAALVEEKEKEANEDLGLDDHGEPLPDIDYDDDDEENLRRHAARGAQAAMQAARDKARAFDKSVAGQQGKKEEDLTGIDLDGDELNFQNPSLGADSITITQPKMLMAQLKEYQLKGLTWLGNLYEQGINGILADEMGLGKTIQSISLLAFLAEHHNLWGPFLVIAPSSTLHNWQQELARFVPRLKALPYWGSPKDRETLRRIWSRKNMTFDEDSPFHILVTSYQLAVLDDKYLQGVKWQYMILDEAQAIKSSSSARWKSLLSLPCRNRLLLTGTPIQNSMHELWALLHFIMPSLFDSHEEFSEWFSKDIENAAGGTNGNLKPEQLKRLHMILKPFMLRRVKKHVQKELGDKIEIDVLVDLSQRQRAIYKALRTRVSVSDLIAQANNLADTAGAKNLMNLVMQFRKVCNHPDLFERADVVSPLMFGSFAQSNLSREQDGMYLPDSAKNAIQPVLPRLLWDDSVNRPSEESNVGGKEWVLRNLCNIWTEENIRKGMEDKENNTFGWRKILDFSPRDVAKRAQRHPLVSLVQEAADKQEEVVDSRFDSDPQFASSSRCNLSPLNKALPFMQDTGLPPLSDITNTAWNQSFLSRTEARFTLDSSIAPRILPSISSRSYTTSQDQFISDPIIQKALYGATPSEMNDPKAISKLRNMIPSLPPTGLISASPRNQLPSPTMLVPPIKRLIVDSAKLARLDELLRELKDGGHRVLLYFQMTKMMDLVEEYLVYRQYKYLRLDGGSAIGDRRDMVTSWQTNPEIFIFCLSTRAGGLGINLTAADTVIFYDHDWNPSNDAQAMDRAHRVGQTKQVTVYRLLARGTIEERIVKLARAKKDVQDIVVGTKSLTDVAKPSEIVSLFMDDEELAESVAKRKQAEAHGYVAPQVTYKQTKSAFGDGLGISNDDDEDDFFSLTRKPANNEDEDFGDETTGNGSGGGGSKGASPKKKSGGGGGGGGGSKRKAPAEPGSEKKPPAKKKKVKIALGPDGLPL